MEKKNTILVCTHIPFSLSENNFYKLIHAGAKNNPNLGIIRDDEGINISEKNYCYCETTALYWGWKNLNYDFLGLVHYRRYFKGNLKIKAGNKTIHVISEEKCKELLSKYDIIVSKKRHYVIESLYGHYCSTLRKEPIVATEEVIKEKYPEYLDEFNNLKKRRSAHMFNMMIANKSFLDKYLTWLFDILGEVEKRVDSSNWGEYEKRFNGSISELMLDIYLRHNHIKYKEVGYHELIPFAIFRKGMHYLKAKFFGKKYKDSVK